jgi:monoamine oxidase
MKMKRRTFLQAAAGLVVCGRTRSVWGISQARRDESVVVIGAGMAGLAAAASLQTQGFKVLVLEARQRIGGRMKTDRSLGCPVDLGASWVHGVDGNPLVELAKQSGAKLARTHYTRMAAFDRDGTKLDTNVVSAEHLRLLSWMSRARKEGRDAAVPTSLNTSIERAVAATKWPPVDRRAFDLVWALEEISEGARFAELSARGSGDYHELTGGDHLVVSGYDTLARHLARGLEIRKGIAVDAINSQGPQVRIETRSGTLPADRVVVTVPLGVLQAGRIQFTPALPAGKQAAIQRVGMGLINKIALRFEQPFWPREAPVLTYAGQPRGKYPLFVNLAHFAGQPLLVCLVPPSFENALENLTPAAAQAGLLEVLRTMFGSKVPAPTAVLQTRWKSDPWSLGSYSFDKLGAVATDRDALAAPIDGRLFFAGEATHRTMFSTVHGAYLSGLRAAAEIGKRAS